MKSIITFLSVLLLGSQYGEVLEEFNRASEVRQSLVTIIEEFWVNQAGAMPVSEVQRTIGELSSVTIYGTPQLYSYDGETLSECPNGVTPSGIQLTVVSENVVATLGQLMNLPYAYHSVEVYRDRSAIVLYVAIGGVLE